MAAGDHKYWLRKEQRGLQHRHQPQHTKHSSDDSKNQVPLRPPFLSTFAPESASNLSTGLVYATPARQKQPRHSLAALFISVPCYKVQERCSRPPCRVERRYWHVRRCKLLYEPPWRLNDRRVMFQLPGVPTIALHALATQVTIIDLGFAVTNLRSSS